MRIIADYHTHTTYSHGLGSIEDNVVQARKIGLKRIAISDHGPGHMAYGIRKEKYKEMRQVINDLRSKYTDIEILLGMEANILDVEGNIDMDDELLALNDILLAGYHFGSKPTKFFRDMTHHGHNIIAGKVPSLGWQVKQWNTEALVNAMYRHDIQLITHPGAKGPIDLDRVVEAGIATNTALEINASHGYLTTEQLKQIKHTDVKFMINSDAHQPDHVGHFKAAIKRAKEAGLRVDQILNAEA